MLFLAALPILTMITMSFSAADTYSNSRLRLRPALRAPPAAWHSFVSPGASDSLSDGRRAQHRPDRRALDDGHRHARLGARRLRAEPLPRFRDKPAIEQLVALPLVYPLVMLGLSLLLVFNVPPQVRTRASSADHAARDSGAAVHREKLRGVGGLDRGPEFEEAACVMGLKPESL